MRRVVIGLLCLPVLAACARPGPAPAVSSGTVPGPRATATTGVMRPPGSDPSTEWVTYQADVTAVRIGTDPRSLLLTVALLAGAEGCSRSPRITYFTEENNHIYANVVQDSRLSQVIGACPSNTPGAVTLTAPDPINGRIVVLNQQAWKPDGNEYHHCDATFGCDPLPADHCAPAWIQVAVKGLDVSRHSTGTVERCDGRWLVMTVPLDPVPCGAQPRPGCVPVVSVRRYFLRWAGRSGWSEITSSAEAGCGAVLTVEPEFPNNLCATLPKPS